ncbi:MAG: sugar ABC transporter substrate-binding protein [Thermoanaerobaculia bacterium]
MARRKALKSTAALAVATILQLSCSGQGRGDPALVRFWALGREGEVVRELIPEFERRNPGVHVELQQIPWVAAHEKLLTAFVGHATPDVAQIGNTWISEFSALGAIAPLDEDLRTGHEIDRGDYFPGSWDANIVDDVTWGVPWYVDTRVIFYRTDLVAESGAAWPPHTWSEWREAMRKVKAHVGKDRFAILLPIDEWEKPVLLGMQTGAELLSDGGRHGAFRDPRFRTALDFYAGLFTEKLAPPLTYSGVANLYQQFAEGYFAMLITGPWNLGEFRDRLPPAMQDRWSTTPMPAPDGSGSYPGTSLAGGSSLVLFRSGSTKPAAWRFIEFLSAPDQQVRFHELTGNLPARRSAWDRTNLADDPRSAAFRLQLSALRPLPKVPECEQIALRVADAAEQVVRGARTLDGALELLDHDVDRILGKRRFMLDRAAARANVNRGAAGATSGGGDP